MRDGLLLHRRVDDNALELALGDDAHRHRGFDGGLEQLLDTGLAEGSPEAADLCGVARQARLEVDLAAEELEVHVLGPALDHRLVALVVGGLQIQQRRHQPHRQTRTTCVARPRAGQLQRAAEQIRIVDDPAGVRLVGKDRGQRLLDLAPGHARGQNRQRVAQVDHLVESRAEEILSCHGLKLPGTALHWNQFREFTPFGSAPRCQRSCGLRAFCRPD